MHKQQSGFTLIELIVVMVIVGLLGAVAVPKFIDVTKKAEAASVKNILGSVRSGLSLKVASGLVNGDDISEWRYDGSAAINPMDALLSDRPENYLGLRATNAPNSEVGKWWDRTNGHWLMYKLKNNDLLTTGGYTTGSTLNIIHRIDEVTEGGEVVGLTLTPTTSYDYTWAE